MPNTLIPIQTYTLASAAASVTFSNIPQGYTDLKLVVSSRENFSGAGAWGNLAVTFNSSGSGYSERIIIGSDTASGSLSNSATSGQSAFRLFYSARTDATANTFSNNEMYIPNYTSSNNKSAFYDTVVANSSASSWINLVGSGVWANSAAITSITIASYNSVNLLTGCTFTLYGISNGVKATGGTLTVAGGYAYHTFTSTGSFLPNQRIKNAEVLCVAGGAGGGYDTGGGGGAGGVLYAANQTLNAGTSYTALVGSGGAGGTSSAGTNGGVSVLLTTSPLGGGGGGGITLNGVSGGSGGGAAGAGSGSSGGTGTAGQGNNGGINAGSQKGGAGGGGAGAVGQDGQSTYNGGAGGIGTSTYTAWHSITGTGVLSNGVYYIAAGGGGGSGDATRTGGAGGIGGGGRGADSSNANISAGTANTGSGGGGGCGNGTPRTGAAGGSGLIIVRYPLS